MTKHDNENDLDLRPGALISVSAAAKILSVHASSIYRLFESGHLTKIRILGRVRISKSQLIEIIKNGAVPADGKTTN